MFLTETHTLFVSIFILFFIKSKSSIPCDRSCGGAAEVPYPFGFSNGCEIQLNCSETEGIRIHEFKVESITNDTIVIDLPARCDRPIGNAKHLFSKNYGLTSQNGLLLGKCTSKILHKCRLCREPATFVETNFEIKSCTNLSCYSTGRNGFIDFENISQSGCNTLFSSIASGSCDKNDTCSWNSNCTNLVTPSGPGFRCHCKEGFFGDGNRSGEGCRKASSNCNPSSYMSGKCGGTTRVGVLIGGIVAGAIFMAGLALLCYCLRRRQSTFSRSHKDMKRLLSETMGSCSIPFYTYREIEKATNYFSEDNMLGTGAYGTVYAGIFHNDEWVAIKKIRHRDQDGIEQVMNEVKLLSSVSHPNLVRLLGYCLERSEQILVYEYMPNGTLAQHLQRERGAGLPWTVRLTIASETAQAITDLYSANIPIYHRDIKSSNILLDAKFNSKVADFGLSRVGVGVTELSHISTAPQGTPGYLDPQYHQNFHLSDKSDVYSFGVLLVEIITAQKVVDFSRPQTEINLAALTVDKIGKGSNRDAWTLSSVQKVAELAFRCLAFHRDMRPSMMEVASELEYIRHSAWAPMEEGICGASSVGSTCSSVYDESDQKLDGSSVIKKVTESHRLTVSQRVNLVTSIQEVKDRSPLFLCMHHFLFSKIVDLLCGSVKTAHHLQTVCWRMWLTEPNVVNLILICEYQKGIFVILQHFQSFMFSLCSSYALMLFTHLPFQVYPNRMKECCIFS
ncbi:hypothetical protein MKX01_005973 [Papaver californicum]|nr:hypothetical protein MKX01_005973 [Papaver californicum]